MRTEYKSEWNAKHGRWEVLEKVNEKKWFRLAIACNAHVAARIVALFNEEDERTEK